MKNGKSVASLVLGIVGVVTSIAPVISTIGLILGIQGKRQKSNNPKATAGIIMSIIGLTTGAILTILGALFGIREHRKSTLRQDLWNI